MIGFSHFFLTLLPTVNVSLGSKHSYANELISPYSVHMKIEVNVIYVVCMQTPSLQGRKKDQRSKTMQEKLCIL